MNKPDVRKEGWGTDSSGQAVSLYTLTNAQVPKRRSLISAAASFHSKLPIVMEVSPTSCWGSTISRVI